MAKVILKNKLRQMRTFNLEAPFFVKRSTVTPYGKPETLTLLALEKKEVEEAVLACAEIKSARNAGTLRVIEVQTPNPVAAEVAAEPEVRSEDGDDF